MSNNIYLHEEKFRGKEALDIIGKKHITICGAGAIGSNLADSLARQGFKSFRIIDFDRVDAHNINNQLYTLDDVGKLKVAALEEKVYSINKGNVDVVSKKIDDDNIKKYIRNTDLVIDAFDNIPSRGLVSNYCRKLNLPCIHAGVLVDFGEVVWNESYKLPSEANNELDACEYPLARNIVLVVVVLSSEIIIEYILSGKKRAAVVSLKNLAVRYI